MTNSSQFGTLVTVGNKLLLDAVLPSPSRVWIIDMSSNLSTWTPHRFSQDYTSFSPIRAGDLLVFVGYNVIDIYSITTDQWTTVQLPEIYNYYTITTNGRKVLIIDPFNKKATVLDLASQTFTPTVAPNIYYDSCTTAKNKAYCFGPNGVNAYDYSRDIWTSVWPDFKPSNGYRFLIPIGNVIFLVERITSYETIQALNMTTGRASNIRLPEKVYLIEFAQSYGNTILMGIDSNIGLSQTWIYDIVSQNWTIIENSTSRMFVFDELSARIDNHIYAIEKLRGYYNQTMVVAFECTRVNITEDTDTNEPDLPIITNAQYRASENAIIGTILGSVFGSIAFVLIVTVVIIVIKRRNRHRNMIEMK
eukprot:TRINITY_DN6815_c0_g2_i1.p1 TRINITY_DN6815_c0_g2~~TRINITY_DN6815_c0_g2_i1.p1  ORF type:complete len:411 (-),score=46.60 TRINITY_DN6815_c0_g2_i1:52-1140(-)